MNYKKLGKLYKNLVEEYRIIERIVKPNESTYNYIEKVEPGNKIFEVEIKGSFLKWDFWFPTYKTYNSNTESECTRKVGFGSFNCAKEYIINKRYRNIMDYVDSNKKSKVRWGL